MMKFGAPLLFLLLVNATALAQTTPPSQACTPAEDAAKSGAKGAPLGEKLSDSKGVICPPATHDSEMKVPPPETGAKMPVIKPPANAK